MDRERIKALRRCIEQMRLALQNEYNDNCIIAYSGRPPYPAVAILENMRERGS